MQFKNFLKFNANIQIRNIEFWSQDVSAPPHMLHYAHELARKDLDISQLRKEKHIMEGQFR